MRSVDLAVYADRIAAEFASASARLERARRRLRQGALERRARAALPVEAVARLEALGLLSKAPEGVAQAELTQAQADLAALRALQGWIESEVAAGGANAEAFAQLSRPPGRSPPRAARAGGP